jgi:hypothetical protein
MSVDLLTEDSLMPNGQNYVCISFLKDPDNKTTLSGIKVRGVFDKQDDAGAFAKKLQSYDTLHNIYVGEMGKWLAFDPDPNSQAAGSPEYANEELNKIMKAHMESADKSKLLHEEHKNKQAKLNIEESLKITNKNKDDINKELEKANDEKTIESLNQKLKDIDVSIKDLDDKRSEYSKKEDESRKALDAASSLKKKDD